MKKIIALVLALILISALPVYAENAQTTDEADIELYTLEGIVTEITENYFIIDTTAHGEVQVNFDAETYFTDYTPFACGQYAFVTYGGMMTASIPAQIYAMNVTVCRMIGKVIAVDEANGYIVVYNELQGEVIVHMNETDAAVNYEKDEMVMVYNNGAMTLSLPPQVTGSLIVHLYTINGTVTEITDDYIVISQEDDNTVFYQVNFADDTVITITSTKLMVGNKVSVLYNGMMSRSLPAQITALEIIAMTETME